MAGTMIATIPILIVFILGQRYFTQGIALTGIKG
jgi:multiple sugar transport system permease protein